MKQPITICVAFIAILAGTSICAAGSQAQTKKPPEKGQAEAGSTEKTLAPYHKLDESEWSCIVRMLSASTLAQAKARNAVCKDSFALHAYYASLLVQLHAPGADDEVVRTLPQNAQEMDQFYPSDVPRSLPYTTLPAHAYERFYNSVFRIVMARPELLPRFFAIADRYGETDPDNVDELGWFCDELHKMHKRMPATYMKAVRNTKNKEYRESARGCGLHISP
jgi:hypothetical protein